MLSYFTLKKKNGGWFWGVERAGACVLMHSGRLGKPGEARVKAFTDEEAAASEVSAMTRKKRDKGYAPEEGAVEPPEPLTTLFQILQGFLALIERIEAHPQARLVEATIRPPEPQAEDPLAALTAGVSIRYTRLSRDGAPKGEGRIEVDPSARGDEEPTAFFEALLAAAQAEIEALGDETPRHDLLAFDQRGGFPLTQHKCRELMNHLLGLGIVAVRDAHFDRDRQRFVFGPGPLAHRAFIKGKAPGEPPFYEGRFESFGEAQALPFGEEEAYTYFFIKGSLYTTLGADFIVRLSQLLNLRLQTTHRAFDAAQVEAAPPAPTSPPPPAAHSHPRLGPSRAGRDARRGVLTS